METGLFSIGSNGLKMGGGVKLLARGKNDQCFNMEIGLRSMRHSMQAHCNGCLPDSLASLRSPPLHSGERQIVVVLWAVELS